MDRWIDGYCERTVKKQRTCIFCGRKGGMSKEHFWPNWLRRHYKLDTNDAHILAGFDLNDTFTQRNLSKKAERQGHLITKKIRAVCKNCNNGWMSSLEESVKPVLENLILGRHYKLTEEQQEDLSLWAVVKVIIAEHASEHIALAPADDRHQVFNKSQIPDYFRVYVGMHFTAEDAIYHRHSVTITYSQTGELRPTLPDGIDKNLSTVTFVIGPLVFHVIAARVDGFNIERLLSQPHLQQIWPTANSTIDLSGFVKLGEQEVLALFGQLQSLLSSKVSEIINTD